MFRFGIIIFPGSNCDYDCQHIATCVSGTEAKYVWHKENPSGKELAKNFDCLILPGGFSYGDYLRSGAIAHSSPIMTGVKQFADSGAPVLGICNGFQILLETGLLPGAMLQNRSLKFICKDVYLKVANCQTRFTSNLKPDQALRMPIAHHEGNYFVDEDTLKRLTENEQIAFRYCSALGEINEKENPNGAIDSIAGVFNEKKNILGMMPHPERCSEDELGNIDGRKIFEAIIK